MKSFFVLVVILALSSFAFVSAQTSTQASPASNPSTVGTSTGDSAQTATPSHEPTTVHKALLFRPPQVSSGGELPIRVGGGSRGTSGQTVTVEVLVPDQAALTTSAQPSLYWYQSAEAKNSFEVTITEPKNPKPLIVLKSQGPTPAGIHAIRLSKFNVELKPEVVYRWNVAVIMDPENRSQDVIAKGVIKRINPTSDLSNKLAGASDADKPSLYAENGIWYDALQAISDQIDHDPNNAALRQQRADLLKQVGMDGTKMEAVAQK